jgi:hypothetical protein
VGARVGPTVLRTSVCSLARTWGWPVSMYTTNVSRQAVCPLCHTGKYL